MPTPAKQFLVIGANSQVGKALLPHFAEGEVILKTREGLDITNLAVTRRQVEMLRPDVVINLAAHNDWLAAEKEPEPCWRVNAQAVDNLVKMCALRSTPFIHVSSGDVFSMPAPESLHREIDPVSPVNVFATSKAAGESAILNLGQAMNPEYWDRGFRYFVIRTSLLFEKPWRPSSNLLYRMVQFSDRKRDDAELKLPRDVYRSPTYAPHLAKALAWLMRHPDEMVTGVYHVASAGQASLYSIVQHLSYRKGLALRIESCDHVAYAKSLGVSADRIVKNAGLCCKKWNDVCPEGCILPGWEDAVEEFAQAKFS